jgi:hypothetical protein
LSVRQKDRLADKHLDGQTDRQTDYQTDMGNKGPNNIEERKRKKRGRRSKL